MIDLPVDWSRLLTKCVHFCHCITSLPKVIWEEGRVAVLYVAHVRRKVPIGYNGAPQIRSQKYPFPWTDPQTPVPASSLDPSDLCQTASGSDPPFCHKALHGQTDRSTDARTYGPTDRPQESLTTIGRCATRATRPNNTRFMYYLLCYNCRV